MSNRLQTGRPLRVYYRHGRVLSLVPSLSKQFYRKVLVPVRRHLTGLFMPAIVFMILTGTVVNAGPLSAHNSAAYKAAPIQLTSFEAQLKGRFVVLSWNTASEMNSYMVEIERQVAGGAWKRIGSMPAHGTTREPHDYRYTDDVTEVINAAGPRQISYRVKFIDLDGRFSYSDPREVDLAEIGKGITLSQNNPNPFSIATTVTYSIPDQMDVFLGLFDANGMLIEVLQKGPRQAGQYTSTISGARLNSGLYYCRMVAGSTVLTRVLTVVK